MRRPSKRSSDFVWQLVLVDRELLERTVRTTQATGPSEAIDRALTLAMRRAERPQGWPRGRAREEKLAGYRVH